MSAFENFNFDEEVDRTASDCIKWGWRKDKEVIPMWVADMDFKSPAPVQQALQERAAHGIYGYAGTSDGFYNAAVRWMQKQFNWNISKDDICFTPGVVVGLNICIHAYSRPGDQILIQMPVYHPFFHSIENNGRQLVNNQLIFNESRARYEIDWEDLENKLKQPRMAMMLFCSPHNPVARVWEKEEVSRLVQLCAKYEVLLVSDEIHSDLVLPPYQHTPAPLAVSASSPSTSSPSFSSSSSSSYGRIVTLFSASKTFNLAGLSSSVAVICDKKTRDQYQAVFNNFGFFGGNLFGLLATEVAYTKCDEWLARLLKYLEENISYLNRFLSERPHLQQLMRLLPTQATYLVWIDCRRLEEELKKQQQQQPEQQQQQQQQQPQEGEKGQKEEEEKQQEDPPLLPSYKGHVLHRFFVDECKVWLSPGSDYGNGGDGFMRMNVACSRALLVRALEGVERAVARRKFLEK